MNRNDKLVLENCYDMIFQEQNDVSFEEKNGQIIESEVRLNLNLEGLDDIEGYRNRDDENAIPNINWDSPSKIKIKWFLMLDHNEVKGYLLHFDDIEVEYEDYRNSKDDSDPETGKIKISSKGFDFKKIRKIRHSNPRNFKNMLPWTYNHPRLSFFKLNNWSNLL